MFWCIPSFFYRNTGLKRTNSNSSSPARLKQISGPVELEDQQGRMHFKRHHPEHPVSEPGAYYLVPNKHGVGKPIIRRPVVPAKAAPYDDMDTTTQAPTVMAQKAETDLAGRTRGSPMTAASIPLDDNCDAATNTAMGGDSNTDSQWRTPSNRTRDRAPARVPTSPKERYWTSKNASAPTSPNTPASKTVVDSVESYGDYGLYMREMERMFGGHGDLQISLERKSPEYDQVERREPTTFKSRQALKSRPLVRNTEAGKTVPYHSRFDAAHRGFHHSSRVHKRGPKPGQEYEVVSRKVIEDTPEKTVSIDTWREQVAREADNNVIDPMSIYYMGPDDFAAADRTTTEVDSNVQRTLQETRRSDSTRSIQPADEPSKEEPAAIDFEGVNQVFPTSRHVQSSPQSQRPPSPPQKPASNHHPHSASSHSLNAVPPRMATPEQAPAIKGAPRPSHTGRKMALAYQEPTPSSSSGPLRSSTPISNAIPQSSNQNVHPSNPIYVLDYNPQSPLQESTPIRASMSPIPFHPRQSQGSTISTIKSESIDRFENFLDSCQPSLLHIAPILARLGITKEEHLKAVMRLSEEMRDKEVREEALKMGVTVVEWAILLDKVRL